MFRDTPVVYHCPRAVLTHDMRFNSFSKKICDTLRCRDTPVGHLYLTSDYICNILFLKFLNAVDIAMSC